LDGTTDLYDALAPIYDAWQAANDMRPFALVTHAKVGPLLEREAKGGALSFLDVGCGTGTLLDALAAAHPDWRLAGADGSRGMLAVAREKLAGAGAKAGGRAVALVRAALDGPLPFARPFDAAGVFYDTLNHLPDAAALARALAAVARAVRPGGLVVFDLTNRLGFDRWWRGTSTFRASRWRLTIEPRFDRSTDVGTADVRIEREGAARRFRLYERFIEEGDVRRALAAAGLTAERAEPWSPFEIDVPGKTWWTARRNGEFSVK
jgi:SAM-dependent methyltransferase